MAMKTVIATGAPARVSTSTDSSRCVVAPVHRLITRHVWRHRTSLRIAELSGQGFELVKQLLAQRSHRFILGVRDPVKSRTHFDALGDNAKQDVTLLKLDLNDLPTVRQFATDALSALDGSKLDFVLLNAALSDTSKRNGSSKWCEPYVVNQCVALLGRSDARSLSQHYLLHLLRDEASPRSRPC